MRSNYNSWYAMSAIGDLREYLDLSDILTLDGWGMHLLSACRKLHGDGRPFEITDALWSHRTPRRVGLHTQKRVIRELIARGYLVRFASASRSQPALYALPKEEPRQ